MHVGRMVAAVRVVSDHCVAVTTAGPCKNGLACAMVPHCHSHASWSEKEAIHLVAQSHRLWLTIHGRKTPPFHWQRLAGLFSNARAQRISRPWSDPDHVRDTAGAEALVRAVFGR